MLFDSMPKIIQQFEELGYAKCRSRIGRRGKPRFKNVRPGDVFTVKSIQEQEDDPLNYFLYFSETPGKFSAYYFKPITKEEFEKRRLMEVLK